MKGDEMMLWFHNKVREVNLTYHQVFEIAHQWRFGRVGSIQSDFAQFLLHGIIPKYVEDWCKHCQEKEVQQRLF